MKKEFIEALATKRSVYLDEEQSDTMANLLDTVSSDIYSQNIRFVFELIQNADDAGSESGNDVRFDFFEQAVVVSHNGGTFNEKTSVRWPALGEAKKRMTQIQPGIRGAG